LWVKLQHPNGRETDRREWRATDDDGDRQEWMEPQKPDERVEEELAGKAGRNE